MLIGAVALLVTLVWHREAFAVGARRAEPEPTAAERERARALVLEHGTGTLDYFALRPDKRYFFTRAGDAMLAYRDARRPRARVRRPDRCARGATTGCCRSSSSTAASTAGASRSSARARPTCRCTAATACARSTSATRRSCAPTRSRRRQQERPRRRSAGSAASARSGCCARPTPRSVLRDALNELRERWRDGDDERGFTMELGGGVRGEDPELLLAVAFAARRPPARLPAARAVLRRRARLVAGPHAARPRRPERHDRVPDRDDRAGAAPPRRQAPVAELRHLGSAVRATTPSSPCPSARSASSRRCSSPYFQIESLRDFNAKFEPGVGAALDRRPGRRGPPLGRAAVRGRRGLRPPAGFGR